LILTLCCRDAIKKSASPARAGKATRVLQTPQQGELAALRVWLPQAGNRKQRFARLDEADAFFKNPVGENQTAVLQVRLECGQLGDGLALGIDECAFVPRHTPSPAHLPAREALIFGHDDRAKVSGPDVRARHCAEDQNLVLQPQASWLKVWRPVRRWSSTDENFRCVHPVCTRASGCSAQHRAGGRNIFAPAVTQLLMPRCPAARAQPGAFCQERSCSLRAGEESSPAPSEQNAKHEHN